MLHYNLNNNLNHTHYKDSVYKKIYKGIYDLNLEMTDIKISDSQNQKTVFYKSCLLLNNRINFEAQAAINNSFVIKLIKTIIYTHNNFTHGSKGRIKFNQKFYYSCINNLLNNTSCKSGNDKELLLIYLKQINLIIKSANIVNLALENPSAVSFNLYQKLFDSFWNKTHWEDLFPSMPDIAFKLKTTKNLLINLMLKKQDKFRIDEISNDFIRISGLGEVNDLLLISFLDFYFFTWLSHFSIIKYIVGKDLDPVMIELTAFGRIILEHILSG